MLESDSLEFNRLYYIYDSNYEYYNQLNQFFRIYGQFDFAVRKYIVRDPEVLHRICVKDFDYFEDHRQIVDERVDDLFGNSLIALRGEKWRQMRATLCPAFAGANIRQMFELVADCANEIVKSFRKKADNGEEINLEMKDFFSRYTSDVIATTAFGIKVNSFDEPTNEFFVKGKSVSNFGVDSFWGSIKFMLMVLFPKVASTLRMHFFDVSLTEFFKTKVVDAITERQKNDTHRSDLINMLMQVRQGANFNANANTNHQNEAITEGPQDGFAAVEESNIGKTTVTQQWNDTEISAQCFLFFLSGFEIPSSMLTFTVYELVANPLIQQKLFKEIAEMDEQFGGKQISYDDLQNLKYLDQVICESLRKWPAVPQIDRQCVKDYVYDDGNLNFEIERGCNLIVPVYGLHHDPKFFPNPNKFNPARFNDKNKHKIVPGTYLPFGLGPRHCIGELSFD